MDAAGSCDIGQRLHLRPFEVSTSVIERLGIVGAIADHRAARCERLYIAGIGELWHDHQLGATLGLRLDERDDALNVLRRSQRLRIELDQASVDHHAAPKMRWPVAKSQSRPGAASIRARV